MFDRHEILKAHYRKDIEGWDWNGIVTEANQNAGGVYLGSVLQLAPSGKCYAPWTSNQTQNDETRDAAWFEALDDVAEENGGSIGSGDGDGCDVCFYLPAEEE
jgi:hypothetical protein